MATGSHAESKLALNTVGEGYDTTAKNPVRWKITDLRLQVFKPVKIGMQVSPR